MLALGSTLPAVAANSSAATYYIDYATGSNSDHGTSKTTPWKQCPGMGGWNGTYSHAAGDHFIFKGGVTWPNACFTLNPGNIGVTGGTSANPDYYGVDQTWFTGTSWTRPHWDAQGTELNGNGYDVMVLLAGASYITFDNIDLTGLYWSGPKSYSWVSYIQVSNATYITIQNCTFRNWTHAPYNGGNTPEAMICVHGTSSAPYDLGCVIDNCTFDGENTANSTNGSTSGAGTYQWGGRILNSRFRNLGGAALIGQGNTSTTVVEVAGCDIGPIYSGYDPGSHDNGIEENLGGSLVWIHDNYIHDTRSTTISVGGNGGERDYLWNNVFWNVLSVPIGVDSRSASTDAYIWNNTFYCPNVSSAINAGNSAGVNGVGMVGTMVIQNNHVIGAAVLSYHGGTTVQSLTMDHNLLQNATEAAAGGYTMANKFRPLSDLSATVKRGVEISWIPVTKDLLGVSRRPLWDVGAYQFASSLPPASNLRTVTPAAK